jgi:twitching motility protein PilT
VIVIGEMRDPETMRMALTAGETGHLVLSTLHTGDVTSTIARVAEDSPLYAVVAEELESTQRLSRTKSTLGG